MTAVAVKGRPNLAVTQRNEVRAAFTLLFRLAFSTCFFDLLFRLAYLPTEYCQLCVLRLPPTVY